MDTTPAGVRWGLMLMSGLLLTQTIGFRWVGPVRVTGIQAASATLGAPPALAAAAAPAPPASPAETPGTAAAAARPAGRNPAVAGCNRSTRVLRSPAGADRLHHDSLHHERVVVIASRPEAPCGDSSSPCETSSARRSC